VSGCNVHHDIKMGVEECKPLCQIRDEKGTCWEKRSREDLRLADEMCFCDA